MVLNPSRIMLLQTAGSDFQDSPSPWNFYLQSSSWWPAMGRSWRPPNLLLGGLLNSPSQMGEPSLEILVVDMKEEKEGGWGIHRGMNSPSTKPAKKDVANNILVFHSSKIFNIVSKMNMYSCYVDLDSKILYILFVNAPSPFLLHWQSIEKFNNSLT